VAALVVSCEKAEMALVNGDDFDIQGYATACNSLRRLLNDLGLNRHARDVTPDGSEAIKVEVEHHVVEQADNFIRQLRDLSAKRGAETVIEDVTVKDDSE
jgi:hypothetical protein